MRTELASDVSGHLGSGVGTCNMTCGAACFLFSVGVINTEDVSVDAGLDGRKRLFVQGGGVCVAVMAFFSLCVHM